MSKTLLCQQCKVMLEGPVAGDRSDGQAIWFQHHPDAKSVRQALELPCRICSFAWVVEGNSFAQFDDMTDAMQGILQISSQDDNVISLCFFLKEGECNSRHVALGPYSNMVHERRSGLLSDSTNSKSALDFIVAKFHECRSSHPGCSSLESQECYLPARLIDVGEGDSESVRLRSSEDLANAISYTCLSHCWGQKRPLTLTATTYSMLQQGISMSALPITYRDAVSVTRVLGVRYIWIDSLCIFQDNPDDWLLQASRMSKIYSRAICTIAATKAASSEAGLFSERDSALLEPQALEVQWCWKLRPFGRTDYFQFSPGLYWCDVESLWEEVIEKGPLNRRAWVCQERHLSPRIAHFGEGQLFWECHENRASENYPGGLPGWAMPNWFHDPSSLRKRLFATQTDDPQKSSLLSAQGITATSGPRKLVSTAQQLYDEWTRFRIHYTRSLLTMEGDKLVAIQGVAQQLGTALNDELIAGLWRKNLCAELCWTKHCENDEVRPEPTTWRAPTWSWASSNAIIWPGLFSILHARCLRPEVLCEVDHLDMNINNPLNSEDVPLRLRCTPIDVTLIPELARGISRTYWFHGTIVIQSNMTGIEVGIASEYAGCVHPDRPSWDEIMHLQMIVTRRCVHTSDNPSQENLGIGTQVIREGEQHNSSSDDNDDAGKDHDLQENSRLEGLLLEKQHEQDEVYKRVGTFSINACSAISQISMKHDAHESKVITLL